MNVLMLTRLYYPHVGGVEKPVREICKRLVTKGFRISIITEKFNSSLKNKENYEKVNIIRFSYPKIRFLGLLSIWLWLMKNIKLISQSDLVHIHDVFIWYLPFRFIFFKKPVYTTFHGWEGIYPVPLKNILMKRIAAKFSMGNICIGKFIEKYYGIKANFINYGVTEVRRGSRYKKILNSIVFVGRLEQDTGLPLFLKLLRKIKNYKIDFCGDGTLRDECSELGFVNGFVNPTPFQQKALICFASGYFSIIEAFANKCIVFAAYENDLKKDYYKMTPFSKWIIVDENPTLLAQKVKFYMRYPDKANHLVEVAYEWVKGETWEKLTNQYLELWGVMK